MTNEEWDKYVQKQAKKIFVPEWGMYFIPKQKEKCTVFIQNDTEYKQNPIIEEVISIKKESRIKESLTYSTEYYMFKGKRFKRKFVSKYKRT